MTIDKGKIVVDIVLILVVLAMWIAIITWDFGGLSFTFLVALLITIVETLATIAMVRDIA